MKKSAKLKMLQKGIAALVGKKCWGVAAGVGTGSMFTLDLGKKIRRLKVLSNPHLSKDQQCFEPEAWLYAQFAAWRLEKGNKVLCTSTTDNRNDGPMVNGLHRLVRRAVRNAEISIPGLDLAFQFAGGFVLKIFCDRANEAEDYDNYSLKLESYIYIAKSFSKLAIEHVQKPTDVQVCVKRGPIRAGFNKIKDSRGLF